MLKNVFALIGLFVVAGHLVKGFNKHVQEPLERKLANILDQETAAASAAPSR